MPPEIMEDMADAAGDAALEAYQTALDAGEDPSVAASQAIDAASTVMTEMGAPADMVDTMASAAQDGFDSALADGATPEMHLKPLETVLMKHLAARVIWEKVRMIWQPLNLECRIQQPLILECPI